MTRLSEAFRRVRRLERRHRLDAVVIPVVVSAWASTLLSAHGVSDKDARFLLVAMNAKSVVTRDNKR
jgi:hypothetical protein